MVSQKKKWMVAASVGVLAAGGWLTYGLLAKQGQGTLSQSPLNIQASVPPAFLMALDDSGSMFWEVQNNTRDGVFRWVSSSSGRGFFDSSGTPYGYVNNNTAMYYYTVPPYGRGNAALPPLDAYGFVRSPDINPAYFDPREVYPDWKTGVKDAPSYMVIDPKSAPVDPRPGNAVDKVTLFKNLTDTDYSTAENWQFVFQPEMVIPVGTLIRNNVCNVATGRNGNAKASANANFVEVTTAVRVTARCSTNVGYFPATFYLKTKLPASYGYTAAPVEITRPTGGYPGTLYKYEIRQANFGVNGTDTASYNAAMQNFANWFSFYRTRRDSVIGAATNALHETENLRVGWFRINDRETAKMYDMTVESEKKTLLTDIMTRMRATSTTPNRSAATHLGNQFKRTKSRTDTNPPVLLSCQKNAGMLFTDGFINEENNKIRMRAGIEQFYDNSLVPGLEKYAVPIPKECPDGKLDCKTSLHMNFYGVTLGTLGTQFGVTYVPEVKRPWVLVPDPYVQKPTFDTAPVNNAPGAVDELWEAVLYTHGEMVNATKASDITSAMRRIISNVSKGATPSGTRALVGARIGKGSISVEPFYSATGSDWYSTLTAYSLSVDPTTRAIVSETAWEASAKMPRPTARNVWMAKDGAVQAFSASNLELTDLCSKPSGLYGGMLRCNGLDTLADKATAVSYLLGDTSQEMRFQGKLRDRTTVLGDIINSTPLLSSPTDDYGYRRLGNVGDSYVEYLASKRDDRRYMVYAGANDGMLHAFDGGMGSDGRQDVQGGKEVFGYVPATALGHMGNLLVPYDASAEEDSSFEHRYFVDGPVVVGDIHDGGWKTALVGTAGAGGRSVFALDVTDPTAFGADSRLWELNDFDQSLDAAVRDNIGYVLGKPVIVPVRGPGGAAAFKAIFGNGVESKDGKAVLFVVDLVAGSAPTVKTYVVEETGQNAPAGRNGLTNIVVVDRWSGTGQDVRGRDGFADTVYGADQKGAIWKFDLTSDAAPEFPVFTTNTYVETDRLTYRQPIMGGLTATAGPAGGVMLLFGTGSFSYVEDGVDTSIQGLYGVNDVSGKSVASASDTLTSANLRPITVETGTDGRTITMGDAPAGNAGWTVILPAGERFVANPTVTSGVVFMPTYVPKVGVSGGCTVDGSNWLFGLSTGTGAAALSQVRLGTPDGKNPAEGTAALPLDTGGNAPVRDVTTAVVPRLGAPEKSGATPPPTPPGTACMMQVSVAGAPPMYLPYPCGRQSWRQIK